MSDQLETLIRSANAVVRDDELDGLFGEAASQHLLDDIHAKREGRMPEPRQFESETDEGAMETVGAPADAPASTVPRPRWAVAAVVFVAILAIGAVGLFFASQSDSEVADEPAPTTTIAEIAPADPVSVAEAFIAAHNAYDAAAADALVGDDAIVIDHDAGSVGFDAQFEWDEAVGAQVVEHECAPAPDRASGVICTFTHTNEWAQALGVGPFDGSSMTFSVDAGVIKSVVNNFYADEFAAKAWTVFFAWVEVNHPDDVAVMYLDGGVGASPASYTEEALQLWALRTEEFVAEVGSR